MKLEGEQINIHLYCCCFHVVQRIATELRRLDDPCWTVLKVRYPGLAAQTELN
jgi:hypothetical protein